MDSLPDGFSNPVPFVRDNILVAPQEPGVHVVFGPSSDDGVIYVGHTAKQRERMLQHLSGDREASVLYEQVGKLLDGDEPESATREQIQEWLATCQVAWILTDDRIDLKGLSG